MLVTRQGKDLMRLYQKIELMHTQIQEKENCIVVLKKNESMKEKEYQYLLKNDLEFRKKIFFSLPVYKKLLELASQQILMKKDIKILTSKERISLSKNVFEIFDIFVGRLLKDCPNLTKEDILFCILYWLGLSHHQIAFCFGVSDTNSIRQRKYRIKNKLVEIDRTHYLQVIFGIEYQDITV